MIGLFLLAAGLVGQWLFGLFIASCLLTRKNQTTPTLVELLGLGVAWGVGVTAWLQFLWSFCGMPLGIVPSGLIAAAGFLCGGPLLWSRWRQPSAAPPAATATQAVDSNDAALCRACQILIAGLIIVAVLQTLQTPQKLWDERAIFALKAKVLFEERSIRSPVLLDPDFVQYHPRYPLLLPLAEENIYTLLGFVDDRLSKLIFPLLYCGLLLSTAGVLSRTMSHGRAWLAAQLMATVPVMMPYEYGFLCGQADAPVACFHGLSILYLWDGLQRLRQGHACTGPFLVAGICGGLTAFTKEEGIAFLMIQVAILGLFTITAWRHPSNLRRLILASMIYVLAAAVIILPWMIHRRSLPTTTEMNYFERMTVALFLSRLETLNWSVPHLFHRMFWEWREWGLQWWLMVAAFACCFRRSMQRSQLLCLFDVIGALMSLLVAGMLAPAQLDEHIGGSSHRFLMQISPVAVLFAVSLFMANPATDSCVSEIER